MVQTLVTAVVPRVWATGMQRVSTCNLQTLPGSRSRTLMQRVVTSIVHTLSMPVLVALQAAGTDALRAAHLDVHCACPLRVHGVDACDSCRSTGLGDRSSHGSGRLACGASRCSTCRRVRPLVWMPLLQSVSTSIVQMFMRRASTFLRSDAFGGRARGQGGAADQREARRPLCNKELVF